MTTVKLCMLALLGVCVLLILRQWRADFSPLLRAAMTVLLGSMGLAMLSPLLAYFQRLTASVDTAYVAILLRALGVAFLTHYAAEVCRECGEGGMAGSVELVGKIEILLLCLPLAEQLLSLTGELIGLGG